MELKLEKYFPKSLCSFLYRNEVRNSVLSIVVIGCTISVLMKHMSDHLQKHFWYKLQT